MVTKTIKQVPVWWSAFRWVLLLNSAFFPSFASAQALLSENDALYPRVVKLSHNADETMNGDIIASVTSFAGGVGHADIFISRDEGQSFDLLSQINDEAFREGLCCGGLYELPEPVNSLEAGTLLWAGSVGQEDPDSPMQMKIYQSADQGETWSYLSDCLTASKPSNQGGIWEAEFTIAASGELVCFYADETPVNHSQVIRYRKSSDGINWSDPVDVVASDDPTDRPGMPVVVPLPSGDYAMSYEICGRFSCATYLRVSPDGLDWGEPTALGEPVTTEDGLTFWATPTMVLAPRPDDNGSQLVLQGRTLVNGGADQPGNGSTVFISHSGDPGGPWKAYDAPMPVDLPAGTTVNYCQNYSSPLLPLENGRRLLQLASDFSEDGICRTRFNAGPLGGVRASVENLRVESGAESSSEVRLHVSPGFDGDYRLDVSVPEFEGDVVLSQTQVAVMSDGEMTLTLSVMTDSVANAIITREAVVAGVLFVPWFTFMVLLRRRKSCVMWTGFLALIVVLSGCGGSSSNSESSDPVAVISTTYSGILTATNVNDSEIRTSKEFTVTVIEHE